DLADGLTIASNFDIEFRLRKSMIDRNLYSGLIRLHILHHAAEGPIFGQAMIDELGRHGYRLSAGTLYPILHGMERQGYLRSRLTLNGGRNRRVYRATPAGRKARLMGVAEAPMIRSYAWAVAVMVVLLPALAASAQDTRTQPPVSPPVSLTLE